MPRWMSRRRLRRIIDAQARRLLEQRRTIQAQATAINEITESCATWRQLALNTADAVTNALKGGE